MRTRNIILLLIFSGISFTAKAGNLTYDCVIKKLYDIDDKGVLEASGWQSQIKGNKFTVSRETGKILDDTATTILAKKTRVINFGSKDYSFKSVAEFEGQFQLIEIQEFKQSNEKPFIISSFGGAGLATGTCK